MQYPIALAQIHIEVGKVEKNTQKAAEMVENAASHGCKLVLLPELWSTGYDLGNSAFHAQAFPSVLADLIHLSGLHKIIIGGSMMEGTPNGIYNTFTWIDPGSDQPIFYRKTHLFRLMEEDQWLVPGDTFRAVSTDWGLTGLAICYDLRFPELFRHYVNDDVKCFAVSAEWPVRRINHWQILLRARAIENQSYMLAVNCVGPAPKDQFGGCSAVISPWGETEVEGSASNEEILFASIETDLIEQARQFMPVLQDRRPDLYTHH